ncbi:hypothetical protein [Geomonas anaerohicana]|uniref:Uncharacterized protein n=1 Tax=Geomonas anaerohicana TaxID=2798583 RepID=A0ABS0YJ67_9BACT|nr:hypothetical protein [Geomonas anaerohicana]MBJ6752396.1 hypothetical protein [Geomonas anaerohicana]
MHSFGGNRTDAGSPVRDNNDRKPEKDKEMKMDPFDDTSNQQAAMVRAPLPGICMVAVWCLFSLALPAPVCADWQNPSGKSICAMPEYVGTEVYNKYCGGGYQYTPPDPYGSVRGSLGPFISGVSDLIDARELRDRYFGDNQAVDAVLTELRHRLWLAKARAEAVESIRGQELAWLKAKVAKLRDMSDGMVATDQGRTYAETVDELESVRSQVAAAGKRIEDLRQKAINESLRTIFAQELWDTRKNQAIGLVDRFSAGDPRLAKLRRKPTVPQAPIRVRALPPEPGEAPPLAVRPGSLYDYELAHQTAQTPLPSRLNLAPEPAATATDPALRLSELQGIAVQTRGSRERVAAVERELTDYRSSYRTYWQLVEDGNIVSAKIMQQVDTLKKKLSWLAKVERNAELERQTELWKTVLVTTKIIVWDLFKSRHVVPEIFRTLQAAGEDKELHEISETYLKQTWGTERNHILKAWKVYGRAKEFGTLVKNAAAIESDFELMSQKTVNILGQAPTAEAFHDFEAIWGAHEGSGKNSLHAAFQAMGTPGEVAEVWDRFLTREPE